MPLQPIAFRTILLTANRRARWKRIIENGAGNDAGGANVCDEATNAGEEATAGDGEAAEAEFIVPLCRQNSSFAFVRIRDADSIGDLHHSPSNCGGGGTPPLVRAGRDDSAQEEVKRARESGQKLEKVEKSTQRDSQLLTNSAVGGWGHLSKRCPQPREVGSIFFGKKIKKIKKVPTTDN